jgi:hypothetical protein
MAVRKTARTDQSEGGKATNDLVEQKMVALAEQLGWFIGTVQAKADGWLDRASAEARQSAVTPAVAPTVRANRGAVDAPGKRHRKPPPQESLDRRMGAPMGKQMGQKSAKNRMRSGRG